VRDSSREAMSRRRFLKAALAGLAGMAGLRAVWPLGKSGDGRDRGKRLSRRRARHYRRLAG
jgi:hypothetical protein